MAEENPKYPDVPDDIVKTLQTLVTRHCLELASFEQLAGTPERGKRVAEFMRDLMGDFLTFNQLERRLIVKFIFETEEAVEKAMKDVAERN
jgi:hypothetical protein